MSGQILSNTKGYNKLEQLAKQLSTRPYHLKHLITQTDRLENFSLSIPGFFKDFSRQRVNQSVMDTLHDLAKETDVQSKFNKMAAGETINTTEKRAVLHTAARNFRPANINEFAKRSADRMQDVYARIKKFSHSVHNEEIQGSTGKPFTDAVIIGIGGSYLGCQFVYEALKNKISPRIKLHFLSNVDIDNFGQIIQEIDPETTLWIVVSKSYTTTETMANLNQVKSWLSSRKIAVDQHLVTITAKGSPGDSSQKDQLASFYMFDFIGGRYSVSSAVGTLPLTLAFGRKAIDQFLEGCQKMDAHAHDAPIEKNMPLTAALISIWNSNFLGYNTQGIIPYSSALSKLSPHVQQLYMESNGKNVTLDGNLVDYSTGVVIFGEPGTNAQHSFFQLAHQGQPFPIEFIGVVQPAFQGSQALSKEVTNHQELWSNLIAQAQALAVGKEDENPARNFTGNRPSTTLLINTIDPEHIGMLLSYYEARTVYEGFILGINPFDQFGVELGKVLANDIRSQIAEHNNGGKNDAPLNPIADFYIQTLIKGSL